MIEEAEPQTEVEETLEPETEQAPEQAAEKPPEGFVKAEDSQKDINKQHRKYRDEERAHNKTRKELEETNRQLSELQSQSTDLTVPPIPDPLDENYETKIKERDEAIKRVAKHEADTEALEAQKSKQTEQAETDQQAAMKAKVDIFDANLVQLGLKPQDVTQAANTIVEYGVSETLENVILEDDDGPLFTKYFADNPVDLDRFNNMSVVQLMNNLPGLREKASLLKPQTSNAPDPPDTLSGGGVPEMEDPALKGVIFE